MEVAEILNKLIETETPARFRWITASVPTVYAGYIGDVRESEDHQEVLIVGRQGGSWVEVTQITHIETDDGTLLSKSDLLPYDECCSACLHTFGWRHRGTEVRDQYRFCIPHAKTYDQNLRDTGRVG